MDIVKNKREKVLLKMWKEGGPWALAVKRVREELVFYLVVILSMIQLAGDVQEDFLWAALLSGRETPWGCMEWSGAFSKSEKGFLSPDEGQRAAGPAENRRWDKVPAPSWSSSRPDKKMETKPRPSEDTS